jgi:hypothetical protein
LGKPHSKKEKGRMFKPLTKKKNFYQREGGLESGREKG